MTTIFGWITLAFAAYNYITIAAVTYLIIQSYLTAKRRGKLK